MSSGIDKKTDAWMPLWIGAYLADTMTLTTIQHGAYFLLLIAYWRERAPLVDDDDQLRSITKLERAEWKRIRPVVSRFFKVGDGVWWHKRVEQEIAAADARSKKASSKAAKAAQARWGNQSEHASSDAPSIPQALLEDVHEECPTPSPIPPSLRSGSEAKASGGKPPVEDEKRELYAAGKSLLELRGMAKGQCGSFITKLAKDHGQDIALDAVRAAVAAQPLEATQYLVATCQRLKGERAVTPQAVTVPSAGAEKTAAYLAEQARLAAEKSPDGAARAQAAKARVLAAKNATESA